MSSGGMPYATPDAWRQAAMRRAGAVDADEISRRRAVARAHHRAQGQPDADALADQELYILGKMDLDEYQDYLMFKCMVGVE